MNTDFYRTERGCVAETSRSTPDYFMVSELPRAALVLGGHSRAPFLSVCIRVHPWLK